MSEQDDGAVPEARRRRRWLLPVLASAAAGGVLVVALVLGMAVRPASGRRRAPADRHRPGHDLQQRPERTTPVQRPLADGRRGPRRPRRPRRGGGHPDAARAHLARVVGPVAAGGQPFPGPSLEEEISTCPRLADRLSAALGQKMSYWTGTLPGGGCTWVPVPLEYDSPDYDYVIGVGFVADGTTPRPRPGLLRPRAAARGPRCPAHAAPSSSAARPRRPPTTPSR